MKTSFALLAGCLVFSSTVFAAPDGYVDPITFDGSDAQKLKSQLHQEECGYCLLQRPRTMLGNAIKNDGRGAA